jgi:hypothetical protein
MVYFLLRAPFDFNWWTQSSIQRITQQDPLICINAAAKKTGLVNSKLLNLSPNCFRRINGVSLGPSAVLTNLRIKAKAVRSAPLRYRNKSFHSFRLPIFPKLAKSAPAVRVFASKILSCS